MCPFLSASYLCLLPTQIGDVFIYFPFHGLLNMWEGFMYILTQVLGQSIVLLCVCCPLDPVLPGSYIAIYAYHVSFLLEAREI